MFCVSSFPVTLRTGKSAPEPEIRGETDKGLPGVMWSDLTMHAWPSAESELDHLGEVVRKSVLVFLRSKTPDECMQGCKDHPAQA